MSDLAQAGLTVSSSFYLISINFRIICSAGDRKHHYQVGFCADMVIIILWGHSNCFFIHKVSWQEFPVTISDPIHAFGMIRKPGDPGYSVIFAIVDKCAVFFSFLSKKALKEV